MESKTKTHEKVRKNFMKPDFEPELMITKREQFAVSLRKQKTKAVVQQKRRKILA